MTELSDLSPNLEDYLEAIFVLESSEHKARAKDIADRLDVRRASVTGALHSLSEKGLINYTPYAAVTLTPEGFRIATRVVHRHKVLFEFLNTFLNVPGDRAEITACRMEHHIDDQTLERLIAFIQFIKSCPRTQGTWTEAFTAFCETNEVCQNCKECLAECTPPSSQSGSTHDKS